MQIRFLVPHRVAGELLEHTPTECEKTCFLLFFFFCFLWIWPELVRGRQREESFQKMSWKAKKISPRLRPQFKLVSRTLWPFCCFYLMSASFRSVQQKRQNTNPHWPQWTGNSTRWDTWCNVLFTDSAAFSNYNKSLRHSLYCGTFVRGKLAEACHNNLMEEKLFVCLDTLAILISIIACLLCGSCQKSRKVFFFWIKGICCQDFAYFGRSSFQLLTSNKRVWRLDGGSLSNCAWY